MNVGAQTGTPVASALEKPIAQAKKLDVVTFFEHMHDPILYSAPL